MAAKKDIKTKKRIVAIPFKLGSKAQKQYKENDPIELTPEQEKALNKYLKQ